MIRIENLNYKIQDQIILEEINLHFRPGEIYGIIGPNGAGKSTLLKHIMGLIECEKAVIFYKEKDIRTYRSKDYAKIASFVFQENIRDAEFTVYESLLMGRYPYMDFLGRSKAKDEEIVETILKELELESMRDRLISTLSGGEAQKVFIGRALVQDTPLMLLDEPTSMLDVHNSVELLSLIKRIALKRGLTIVMVLHDLNLAFNYCTQMILMNQGRVILSDETKKVFKHNALKEVYGHRIKMISDETGSYIVPDIEEEKK